MSRWILRISGVFLFSIFFLTSTASADPHFYLNFGVPGVSIGWGHPHYYYPYYPAYYPGYAYPYVYGYPGYGYYGYPGYGYVGGYRGYYGRGYYRGGYYGHRYYGRGGRYVRYGNGWRGGGHWHR
jgi:hypothetical protein